KFKVNKDACIGCGACQAICEDVFEITDDGYATAKDVEVTDEEVKEDAISAMEGCPTSAIEEIDENNKED
ncbi:MAG: ferredoxin, partial [Tenericutes bacterium]|nr:ferredoxin [Mycoplasmatota bacterium]